MSAYQSSDPYGLQSSFMANQPDVDALKKELEAIRKSADTAASIYDTRGQDGDRHTPIDYADFVRG